MPFVGRNISVSVLDCRTVGLVIDDFLHQDVLASIGVTLHEHVLSDNIRRVPSRVCVRKFQFVDSCIQYRLVVRGADKLTSSIPCVSLDSSRTFRFRDGEVEFGSNVVFLVLGCNTFINVRDEFFRGVGSIVIKFIFGRHCFGAEVFEIR